MSGIAFDAAMLARLRASKTEASRVVLDLYLPDDP
jgi:hypothetical protein